MLERLEPRVHHGDVSGRAKADWADRFPSSVGILALGGTDKGRYEVVALEVEAGENSWEQVDPSIHLVLYARDCQDREPHHVVKFRGAIAPVEFFWLFKRFSLVFDEMRGPAGEIDVVRTEDLWAAGRP